MWAPLGKRLGPKGLGCESSAFRMSTETLSQRVKRAADEIYKRTIRNDKNWIDHWHGPEDHSKSCGICREFGITQEDWDRALRE